MTPVSVPRSLRFQNRRPECSWSGQRSQSEAAPAPLRFVTGTTVDDLAEAFERDSGRLKAVVRGYFPCEADVDDLLQDAFVSAKRHLSQFQSRSTLGTWLHRIVVNACLMRLRVASRRREVSVGDPALFERPATSETPQDIDLPVGQLAGALLRLSADHRAVIQLRYYEEFSTRETAQLLGVRPEVVKTRLHRACRELRTLLLADHREDPHR